MIKLRCNQDHFTKTKGFISKTEYQEKIVGLTEEKTYVGYPVSETDCTVANGYGSISSRVHFLIFNDNEKWETYQCNLHGDLIRRSKEEDGLAAKQT